MDQNDPGLPLDSKLRRRGVLAGVAALGAAAMLKVTGAAQAEASVLNDPILYGNNHVGTLSTRIASDVAGTGAVVFNNYPSTVGVATGDAIQARTDKANGISAGVRGIADPDPVTGVAAGIVGEIRGTGNGVGVMGATTGLPNIPAGAHGVGVFGLGTGARTAVKGESTNGYAVWGASAGAAGVLGTTTAAYAVQGAANGPGIAGVFSSDSGVGVRGASHAFVGVVGISDSSIGLYGYNVSPNVPALYAENLGPSGRIAGLFNGDVQVIGNFSVTGVKAAVVPMRDGTTGTVYCQESTEPLFEDFGRAQLTGGAVQVPLDEDFAFLVTRNQYMVFLTPEDNCNGLYVGRRGPSGFEVRELNGGKSNVAFNYRIVAKRRDIQGNRLARHDPNHATVAANVKTALATPDLKIPPNGYGPSFVAPASPARRFAPNGDELPVQLGR